MPIITNYPITLDVHEVLSQVSISVPQDKARRISATLTENGSALYLPDGCRAVFSATKADGTTVNNDCIIEHNTIIRYDFTEQTTAAVGKVDCCFKVYGLEGEYLYGPIFTLVVYENKAGDVIFSEDEKNFLDRIFAAEESRISAELLRDDAERARGVAETSRVAAEQERVTAENARQVALVDDLVTNDPNKYLSARMGKKLNEEKVSTTRTVNQKPLSADVKLTASDVGAAPSGFGLGGQAVEPPNNSLNNAINFGLYFCGPSYAGAPTGHNYIGYGTVLVRNGSGYVIQEYCSEGSDAATGYPLKLIRKYNKDIQTWSEWEWVNPPMQVGVEYRTTERWMGNPVYRKIIDCLGFPANGSKEIVTGIDNLKIIRSTMVATDKSTSKQLLMLPFFDGKIHARYLFTQQKVHITTDDEVFGDYTESKLELWYTKD